MDWEGRHWVTPVMSRDVDGPGLRLGPAHGTPEHQDEDLGPRERGVAKYRTAAYPQPRERFTSGPVSNQSLAVERR